MFTESKVNDTVSVETKSLIFTSSGESPCLSLHGSHKLRFLIEGHRRRNMFLKSIFAHVNVRNDSSSLLREYKILFSIWESL